MTNFQILLILGYKNEELPLDFCDHEYKEVPQKMLITRVAQKWETLRS